MRMEPFKTKCENLRSLNRILKNLKSVYHIVYCGYMGIPGYKRRAYIIEYKNNFTTMGSYFPIEFNSDDEEFVEE